MYISLASAVPWPEMWVGLGRGRPGQAENQIKATVSYNTRMRWERPWSAWSGKESDKSHDQICKGI